MDPAGVRLPGRTGSPLPGEAEARAYALGRALVAEHGVRLDSLLFDADEVLWDWILDFSEMVSPRRWRLGRAGWDLSHREWVQPRPGILGLLFGMHHESLALGLDARLRIWTNGYPYRLWAICREIPDAWALLGLDGQVSALESGPDAGQAILGCAPTLMFRSDYTAALSALLDPARREVFLAGPGASAPVRRTLARHLYRRPLDPNLKLPVLAPLAGKTGLAHARILVDDTFGNVARFVRAGGRALHLEAPAPSLLGRRIPNTVWRRPERVLQDLAADLSPEVAAGLLRLAGAEAQDAAGGAQNPAPRPDWVRVRRRLVQAPCLDVARAAPLSTPLLTPWEAPFGFVIRIRDAWVREQWIGAREELRALLGRPAAARALARAIDPEVCS